MKSKIETTEDGRYLLTSEPGVLERVIVFSNPSGSDCAKAAALLVLAKIPFIFDPVLEEDGSQRFKLISPDNDPSFYSIFWFSMNDNIAINNKVEKQEENLDAAVFHAIQLLKKHAGIQVTITPFKRDSRFDGL